MKINAATSLAVGILMAITATPATAGTFEIGQPFPNLTLPDLEDGQPTSVARFRGRPLVLHVFASW